MKDFELLNKPTSTSKGKGRDVTKYDLVKKILLLQKEGHGREINKLKNELKKVIQNEINTGVHINTIRLGLSEKKAFNKKINDDKQEKSKIIEIKICPNT